MNGRWTSPLCQQDVAPRHAGLVFATGNTCATFAGLIAVPFSGFVLARRMVHSSHFTLQVHAPSMHFKATFTPHCFFSSVIPPGEKTRFKMEGFHSLLGHSL